MEAVSRISGEDSENPVFLVYIRPDDAGDLFIGMTATVIFEG